MATTRPAGKRTGAAVLGVGSVVLHAVVGVLYLGTTLVAPVWAAVVLGLCWLVLLAVALRWTHLRSWWTPVVPLSALALWVGAVTLGERVLGWTA